MGCPHIYSVQGFFFIFCVRKQCLGICSCALLWIKPCVKDFYAFFSVKLAKGFQESNHFLGVFLSTHVAWIVQARVWSMVWLIAHLHKIISSFNTYVISIV